MAGSGAAAISVSSQLRRLCGKVFGERPDRRIVEYRGGSDGERATELRRASRLRSSTAISESMPSSRNRLVAAGGCASPRICCSSRCRCSVTKPPRCASGTSCSCRSNAHVAGCHRDRARQHVIENRGAGGAQQLRGPLPIRFDRWSPARFRVAITSPSALSAAAGSSGISPRAPRLARAASDVAMPPCAQGPQLTLVAGRPCALRSATSPSSSALAVA